MTSTADDLTTHHHGYHSQKDPLIKRSTAS